MPSAPVPFIPSLLLLLFLQDYGTFYFNLYIGNECGFGYSDDDDDYYYDDYYYDDDDRGYDCICATNSSCFVSTQTICLYPGKTIYPYTCGGSYPGEISWEIKYDGTNLTAASSPALGYTAFDDDTTTSLRGYCASCDSCSDADSVVNFTVIDPLPSPFPTPGPTPTPEPTNHSEPTAVPTITTKPSPAPTRTYKPTVSSAPTTTVSPTTKLQASKPPTASPTSLPSPRPTTPSPTVSFKPTSFEVFGGRSIWSGWGNVFVSTEAELPFTKGVSTCDLDAMSDGTCDVRLFIPNLPQNVVPTS